MISYMLVGVTSLSERNHGSSICNLVQRTLYELYNKSHEGLMLSLCQENDSFGLKP